MHVNSATKYNLLTLVVKDQTYKQEY